MLVFTISLILHVNIGVHYLGHTWGMSLWHTKPGEMGCQPTWKILLENKMQSHYAHNLFAMNLHCINARNKTIKERNCIFKNNEE
jgi:hypothetical protein